MPQHVWVDAECKLCGLARTHHHLPKPFRHHRRPALTHEHVPTFNFFSMQPPQRSHLFPTYRVHALDTILDAVDVERPPLEIVLILSKLADFGCA
jgi:hypothetical protein